MEAVVALTLPKYAQYPKSSTARERNNMSPKMGVVIRVSLAVKKYHDHDNAYKINHLIEAGLQFQKSSPFSSWRGAWWHSGRHGAVEVAKNSTSRIFRQQEKRAIRPGLGF